MALCALTQKCFDRMRHSWESNVLWECRALEDDTCRPISVLLLLLHDAIAREEQKAD